MRNGRKMCIRDRYQPEPGTGGAVTKKRRRPIHLHVMVSEEELALIQERMAEAGIRLSLIHIFVALMGDVPRVELFARQSPPGWDVWGNEVESTVPDLSLIHI